MTVVLITAATVLELSPVAPVLPPVVTVIGGGVILLTAAVYLAGWQLFRRVLMRRTGHGSGGIDLNRAHGFDRHDALTARYTEDKKWLLANAAPEEWTLEVPDRPGRDRLDNRLTLRATVFHPDVPSHRHVLLIHGYTSSAAAMMPYARAYVSRGFHAVVPDCRGHGESDGRYITMGWHDRLDVIGWIHRILGADPAARILLHGVSMGAAAVMMAAGEPLPEAVRCIVEDCGYTAVSDILAYHLRRQYHLPRFPFLRVSDGFCRRQAGFSVYEASAVRQLARSRTPMICIHGERDRFVPSAMLEQVFAAAPEPKTRLTVPEAGHGWSAFVLGDAYYEQILAFAGPFLEDAPARRAEKTVEPPVYGAVAAAGPSAGGSE